MGGLYYACMAGAPNLWVTSGFLLLARVHGAVVWVFSTVLLQILTEDRYRGRVFAAEMSLFTASMMLSSVGTTRALDLRWVSVPQATLTLGVISAAVGVVWVARLALGRVPEPRPPAEVETPVAAGGYAAPRSESQGEEAG
jgi:hypothetical protein